MPAKAPSEGTKVNPGKDAPLTKGAHGVVAQDSLAAESQTFREANQAEPQPVSREDLTSASKSHEGVHQKTSSGSTTAKTKSHHKGHHKDEDYNGAPAPTYVQSQYIKNPAGPHGKNIKEDDSIATEDKTKNAGVSKAGTAEDPGRAALDQFARANTAHAASTAGRDKKIDNEQPFAPLGSDAQA
ncbi:hypothetical protein GGR53DRAFT_32985 [Hypoxylon sp. FL1150]|nr:hypothetical protein GGR53DRAFT_32985 [Hypoxylon sp. FL1150]